MKKLLLFLFTSLSIVTQGQNPGDFAQSFGSFPGFDSVIDVVIFQNDEKIDPDKNPLVRLFKKFFPVTDAPHQGNFFLKINSRIYATIWP